jgi:hypothetical protein
MMSEKIRPHHLERKAILYVRQSSAHQVLHNRESSALQYAMRDRLIALGWSEIETVDDDLGRSAAGGVARAGFWSDALLLQELSHQLERRLAVSPWLNEDVQGPRLRCPRHARRTTVCR